MVSFVAGGGAREIGASFYVLNFGGTYVGIDCGLRHVPNEDPERIHKILPGFDVCPRLDYLFVTHGHLDHVGAVPALFRKYENLKVLMTSPTIALAKRQWDETLRIGGREHLPVPFEGEEVARAERAIHEISLDGLTYQIGDFSVRAIPAGHILGAVSFVFTYKGKKIFVTGDISFENQETVEGAHVHERADVLISEATYGGKPSLLRDDEKNRFLADMMRITSRGGKVLIPAFGIGRAQEIFEMLRKSELFGEVPIYLDGGAMQVAALYRKHLPERIYPDIDDHFVSDWVKRKKVFSERACIVIAPSGMLDGGSSVEYAKRWLGNERNALCFSGYVDPCSPGAKVLASAKDASVKLGGRSCEGGSYTRRCEVQHYRFSAHAGGDELAQLREILSPELTIFVHGESSGMDKMLDGFGDDSSVLAPYNYQEVVLS